ncbi:30S ribosomal protein S1 [candidate division WOR-3 bacterium]|nr:30S ribosomal protein S1 [candidate division WOR-3 bacterium]
MPVEDSKPEGLTSPSESESVSTVLSGVSQPEAPPIPPKPAATPAKTTSELYAESFPKLRLGDIVTGRVVKRLPNAVLVDIGLKAEGVLSVDEFRNQDDAAEGREVKVYLEAFEDRDGFPVVSKKKADFQLAWETIKQKSESGEGVPATVIKRVKGGLAVEILGLDAFLPGSQVDLRPVPNLDDLMGKHFEVRILTVNWYKKNIVVSRRLLLEERQAQIRRELFTRLNVGDLIDGTVKTITDFGAFIDIGGVDALLHISDLAWNKVVHPTEVVNVGDQLKIKVISADPSTGRITVGLKQLTPHPWERVEEKYPVGSRVRGRVTTLAEYGAFVELEKGIEGLVHISEMSWTKSIHHPSQIVNVDQEIETVILNVDKENRRISLGLKQTLPDPWSSVDERYHIGQRVEGRVKTLKDFGAFVEIEEGVDGLLHIADMSWTRHVNHPREEVKKGQRIETIILGIDKDARRITLGLKQTQEDPFYTISKELSEGDLVRARIIDLPKPGVVVGLSHEIEGFVPLNQLARGGKKAKEKYQIGEELELRVLRIDLDNRRIALTERGIHPELDEPVEEPPERPERPERERRRERERYRDEELTDRFTIEDRLREFEEERYLED